MQEYRLKNMVEWGGNVECGELIVPGGIRNRDSSLESEMKELNRVGRFQEPRSSSAYYQEWKYRRACIMGVRTMPLPEGQMSGVRTVVLEECMWCHLERQVEQ